MTYLSCTILQPNTEQYFLFLELFKKKNGLLFPEYLEIPNEIQLSQATLLL